MNTVPLIVPGRRYCMYPLDSGKPCGKRLPPRCVNFCGEHRHTWPQAEHRQYVIVNQEVRP